MILHLFHAPVGRNIFPGKVFLYVESKDAELRRDKQFTHPQKGVVMSVYVTIVILALLFVFVPISLLPLFFDKPDDDPQAQTQE